VKSENVSINRKQCGVEKKASINGNNVAEILKKKPKAKGSSIGESGGSWYHQRHRLSIINGGGAMAASSEAKRNGERKRKAWRMAARKLSVKGSVAAAEKSI